MPPSTPDARLAQRRRVLHRMAQLSLLLIALVVGLSAFMRHRAAGLGCEAGPACYGQSLRGSQAGAAGDGAGVAAARLAHRVVATMALILAITLVLGCWTTRPVLPREGALAAGLLALALGLALLGVFTPGSRLPVVAMGNLLGGLAMLALCARLVDATAESPPAPVPALRVAAMVALLLLAAQITLGALVSTTFAGQSCRVLGECVDLARAGGWDAGVLDPWRVPAFEPAALLPNPAAALTQLLHRGGGAIAALALLVTGVLAWRGGHRRQALSLIVLLGLQGALGLAIVALALPLPLVLAHNLAAALLLALLARRV